MQSPPVIVTLFKEKNLTQSSSEFCALKMRKDEPNFDADSIRISEIRLLSYVMELEVGREVMMALSNKENPSFCFRPNGKKNLS